MKPDFGSRNQTFLSMEPPFSANSLNVNQLHFTFHLILSSMSAGIVIKLRVTCSFSWILWNVKENHAKGHPKISYLQKRILFFVWPSPAFDTDIWNVKKEDQHLNRRKHLEIRKNSKTVNTEIRKNSKMVSYFATNS